ncbi:MAG: hypothetical protein O7C75_11210 [Verrucomicrobia bacterium]|nr:hypothetical protein [Verrucomicrobiota bacterium]
MKRLFFPVLIGSVLFGILAVPKLWLGLAYLEEAGWAYAKSYFVRLFIDFLFAWVISLVVWLQLERRYWVATLAFCFSSLLVSVFWVSSFKNAPRAFRQEMAFLYKYIEAEPLRALPTIPRVATTPTPTDPKSAPAEVKKEPERLGPEKQIEQTFYAVLRALKKYESQTVLSLANERTWTYFTELKELALSADREVIEKLKPIDRFQVLALRHIKKAEELVGMTNKNLFEQAVLQGWFYVGDKPDVRIDFIDMLPGGNQAQADIIVNSIIPDERLEFTREQGIWKMDLLQLLPRQEEKLMTTLLERGETEQEFFWNFLKQETGRDPSPDIWKPVVPSPEQG